MVTTGAIIYGQQDFLAYNDEEHPVALQLGGADPSAMAQCAVQAQTRGYDEVNINVGCPSDRVQNGSFGACLMAQPKLVSDCIKAMKAEVDIPVTVKTRLGIDEHDSDDRTRGPRAGRRGSRSRRGCPASSGRRGRVEEVVGQNR